MATNDAGVGGASSAREATAQRVFFGPSEMARRCRSFDWSKTPLGPVEGWPSALRHAIGNVLAQPFACNIIWGPEQTLIYNDAFVPVAGEKHPWALGQPVGEVFPEATPARRPIVERVLRGESMYTEDALFQIIRGGVLTNAWFTLSCVPLRDDEGRVAGTLTTAIETTARLIAEREKQRRDANAAFLADASVALVSAATESAALALLAAKLGNFLGVARCLCLDLEENALFAWVRHVWQLPGLAALETSGAQRLDAAFAAPLLSQVLEGRVLVCHDAAADPGVSSEVARALSIGAFIAAPVVREGRCRFALCVCQPAPRAWEPDEAELLRELAERLWLRIERARAEQRILDTAESYRALFETMSEAFCVLEVVRDGAGQVIDARVQEVNRRAEALIGLPREQIVGRLRSELGPGDLLPLYARVAQTGEPARIEVPSPAGHWFDVRLYARDQERIAVLYDDITERKRTEAALRESTERLRLAMAAAKMGTFVWFPSEDRVDPDLHMLALFGLPESGHLSLQAALTSLLHPEDRARAAEAAARVVDPAGDGYLNLDLRVLLPHGGQRWLSVTGQVVFEGGVARRLAGVAVDISDRKHAEAALRESEERLRLAVAATRLGIYDWDLTTDCVTVNARFREILGLAEGAPIDAALMAAIVHPDDRAFASAQIAQALDPRSSGSYEFEQRALTPGGERWLLRFGQVQFAGAGSERRALRIIGNDRDITPHKRAEQALRASEERQAFLLELSDVLRPLVDPIAIKTEACRMLGEKVQCDRAYYAEMDDAGRTVTIARGYRRRGVPSNAGTYPMSAFDWAYRAFQQGKTLMIADTEQSALIPDAQRAALETIQVRAFIAAPLHKDGRLLGCLTATDLAPRVWTAEQADLVLEVAERTWAAVERARAEAALAAELSATKILQQISTELIPTQGQAVYAKLLDAAMQLIGADAASLQVLEPSGDRLRLLASRNLHPRSAKYWRLVGVGASNASGQALAQRRRLLSTDVERAACLAGTRDLEELRRSGLRAALSTPLVTRSGQLAGMLSAYWRQVHEPAERDFDLFDVLARQVADLLERGRAESEAATARAQAEAANQAKDEFLATLSHELRTPLAAILLWAGALRSGAVPIQDLARAIDAIVKSAESQSRLIEDLLDMSRLASGKLALACSAVDVRAIAQVALDMVKPQASGKQLALTAELGGECLAVLDGTRLEQVLWNLLTNATKFTPTGGAVTLRVRADEARGIELEVSDTGEGISAEFLPHLFEKFRQYDMGETRQHMGLGIGLALARQLTELHGGSIEAESEGLGRGALFRVRLPWLKPGPDVRAAAEARPSAASDTTPLRRLRVLLVDDDTLTRQAMRWTLTRAGASVVDVATGAEALAALGAGDGADVIVSDLGLPLMSGLALIESIVQTARRQGRRTPPSCAVSAHARDVDRRRAIDAGFDMYITKPVSAERLVEAVSDLQAILASGRE